MAIATQWENFDAGRFGQHQIPAPVLVKGSAGALVVRDTGGEGPVFVLLHGWLADSALNWFSLYVPLSSHGRVIGVDLPGHGNSRAPRGFSITTTAETIVGVLDVLGVEKYTLVGYSMGGPISQWLTRLYPERCTRLVQVATAGHLVSRGPANGALVVADSVLGVGAGALDTLMRLGGSRTPVRQGSMWGHALGVIRHGSKRATLQAGRELSTFDSRSWVGQLKVDALVFVTTKDRTVSPASQRELSFLLTAEVVEVAAGHTFCLEKHFPDILCRHMQEAIA